MSYARREVAPPSQTSPGFGHSKKRIALELAALAGGVLLLVLGGVWVARSASGWVVDLLPPSVDVTLGASAWSSLTPEAARCTNPAAQAYVRELADRLHGAAALPFEIHVTVADDPAVNAFALPGGFVTVNHGLLRHARSGEEIAAVLAHELAHVKARHGTQRVLRQLGTGALLSLVFGGTEIEAPAGVLASLENSAYDREQEAEADRLGLEMLRALGLDPMGLAHFFERVAAERGARVPAFISTHPDPGDRAERAREFAEAHPATQKLWALPDVSCR